MKLRLLLSFRWCLALLVVLLLSPSAAASPSWALQDVLVPASLYPFDEFGHAVAIHDATIVIGAPGDDTIANDAGAVYVYDLQGTSISFSEKLEPIELQESNRFGTEVAVDGDLLAVGTAGAGVYVFGRDTHGWAQRDHLFLGLGCAGDVALSGETLVAGCTGTQTVYLFTREGEGWSEPQLLSSATSFSQSFGRSLALWGNWLAVGDPDDREWSPSAGAVTLFRRIGTTWAIVNRFTWPESSHPSGGEFGHCVDLHDGKLLVSAKSARFPQGNWGGGRSYQFTSNMWNVDTTFQNLGKVEDLFGHGCALHGNWIAFGAPEAQSGRGGVYASGLEPSGRGPLEWVDTLNSLGANLAESRFGKDLAMNGSQLVVGAPAARSFGSQAGAAFVFVLVERMKDATPCTHSSSCQSGYCVDGVCCNAPCNTPCLACSASNKGVGPDGVCGVVPAGSDPNDDCERSDSLCGADGMCDGLGACRLFATALTPCGPTECEGGLVRGSLCSGTGECTDGRLASCAPYLCKEGSCSTRCDVDENCASDAQCKDHRCLSSASCDGNHTLLLPDGRKQDCSPYKCSIDGICEQFCNRVQDCVAPYVCNRRFACVDEEPPVSRSSGCGCRTVSSLPGSSLLFWVTSAVLFALLMLRRRRGVFAPLIVLVLLDADVSWASPKWVFQEVLTSPGALAFGTSVALEAGRLIVGAPGDVTGGNPSEAGVVYSYRRVTGRWTLDQAVLSSRADCLGFGMDLALAGDTLVVRCGPPLAAVEIFERQNERWVSRQTQVFPSGWDFQSMSLQADRLVLGHYREVPTTLGSLLLITRSGGSWDLTQTIAAPLDTEVFGSSVALGDRGLFASGFESSNGSVHFLTGSDWSETVSISAPASELWVGAPRVALDGLIALLGPSILDPEAPKVNVFAWVNGSWQWEAALSPPIPSVDFGAALALEGDTALVGARDVGKKEPETGAFFVFESSEGAWSHAATLEPSGVLPVSGFGSVIALRGNLVAVGVPEGAASAWNLGLVFLFARGEVVGLAEPCLADVLCQSGHCVDGICCATPCDGVCEACSEQAKGGGQDGVCGPVAAGKDPRQDCSADPGFPASCGADGACDGQGQCRILAERGTPCGPTTCDQGLLRGRTCDGFGVCLDDGLVSCNPYQCDGDRCASQCHDTMDCAAGAVCSQFGICLVASHCDGNHTIVLDTGEIRDCYPYVCQSNGTCLETCNSMDQCVAPFVCDRSYRCVDPKTQPQEESGCWCALPRQSSGRGVWVWVGLGLGLAGLRRWGGKNGE